jgi:predicted RND superfamily exporter protein
MLATALERAARVAARHPFRVVFAAAALAGLAAFSAAHLELRADLTDLLPSSVEEIEGLGAVRETLGGMDYAVVLLWTETPDPDLLDRAAERLTRHLGERPELVRRIRGGIEPDERKFFGEFFLEHAFLYLSREEVEKALEILSEEGIVRAMEENARLIDSPLPNAVEERIVQDPLNLLESVFLPHFEKRFGGLSLDFASGRFLSPDGHAALLQVWGRGTARDVAFSRRFVQHVRRSEEAMRSDLGADADRLEVGLTGGYPVAVASQASIRGDLIVTAAGSFLCVLAIFFLAFRRISINLTVGLPLALGVLAAFGACAAVFGFRMTAVAAAFGSILVGLGVDFPIHLYSRYAEERRGGRAGPDALARAWRMTGPGVAVAGLTTAVAFGILCLADFRGLVEVGCLVALGLLALGGSMFLLLPALVTLAEGSRAAPKGFAFGISALDRLLGSHPGVLLAVPALAALAAAVFLAVRGLPSFDLDTGQLRSAMPEIDRTNARIEKHCGVGLGPILLVSRGTGRSEALTRAAEAAGALDPLLLSGKVAGLAGPSLYIPPPSVARHASERLRSAVNPEAVIRILERELGRHDFEVEPFRSSLDRLRQSLITCRKGPVGAPSVEARHGRILDPFVTSGTEGFRAVTVVYLPAAASAPMRLAAAGEIRKAVDAGNVRDTVVTGMELLIVRLRDLVVEDFLPLTALAAALVGAMTFLFFRRLLWVALALLPVTLGFVLTLGAMQVLGLGLNFLNVIVLPMIFGLGVDDGIHFVARLRQSESNDPHAALRSAGVPILITSLTTMVGFGSLVLAENPGLRSIAYVAVIGIAACLVCSVVLLPALVALVRRTHEGTGGN